jgi:hypothetical protein
MNLDLVATFRNVASDLLTTFGRPARHENADGDEAAVLIVLDTQAVAVGNFGERMEPQTTIEVTAASGASVGDTFYLPGEVTTDDPFPDEVVWTAAQLLSDDGYTRRFAVRNDA